MAITYESVSRNAPHAPLQNQDAGSSEDLQQQYLDSVIDDYSRTAKLSFSRARKSYAENDKTMSRKFIDRALDASAKAFWWSEDSPRENDSHESLHAIGKWRHDNLGCYMKFDNGNYQQLCLIVFTHKRMGLSVGYYGDCMCSICDQDLSDCPHRRDRSYWVKGERGKKGFCRVCQKKKCGHTEDYLYRTRVVNYINNPVLEEVSIVRRPANPESRLQNFTVSNDELRKALGASFKIGMPVQCHACQGKCPGFTEFKMPQS